MSPPPDREQRFRALYVELRPQLLRFVRRRHVQAGTAEDVVAETLLVLWRRMDQAPCESEKVRAWVFGIARNVLLNSSRGAGRHQALGVRLAQHDALGQGVEEGVAEVVERVDLARAWARLRQAQQETLALVVLDGLDSAGAAAVLGISPVAFRLRLSRARRALRLHLDHHPPAAPTLPAPSRPIIRSAT